MPGGMILQVYHIIALLKTFPANRARRLADPVISGTGSL